MIRFATAAAAMRGVESLALLRSTAAEILVIGRLRKQCGNGRRRSRFFHVERKDG